MTTALFLSGALAAPELRREVLGRDAPLEPARLADHALDLPQGQVFPLLRPRAGAVVEGLLLRHATPEDHARLAFFETVFGQSPAAVPLSLAGGEVSEALAYRSAPTSLASGLDPTAWAAQHGALALETARDIMALFDQREAGQIARRRGPMMVRAASRLRARHAVPTTLRRHAQDGDLRIEAHHQPYAHFFAVEEFDLSFRRFDGYPSDVINRAVFVSGDAVTVLPYDPVRDRVLLIEQFRAGPLGRGDPQPWLLEAIAGRIDPEEGPEQAARREAVEEAGLTLGALELVAHYYPSPGAKSEYLWSYVALCDLPDGVQGVFGAQDEVEDIRGHLVSFEAFMALVASGEVDNAPLLLTALWLQRERTRLRSLPR